jgi:fatty acid desaturase
LKKFKAEDSDKLSQTNFEEKDEFYTVMKERAKKALQEKGIDPNTDRAATIGRALYYFIIIGLLILSGSFHIKSNPIGSFFFAVFGWLVGCLGHDAGHFAASRIPFFNDAGVWGISFLCNPIMWQHQHTFAHHSHTNDFDKDPDLHHFSILLRVHRKFQHDPIYKNQNNLLYVILAYALVVFGECIKIPIGMMKTGFLYDIVEYTDQRRPLRALGMYLHYVGYIALIMLAPFLSATSYWTAFSCGIVHIITAGWLFAVFSQVNHLNEFSIETDRGKTKNKLLKESWAAQQVATSNNFATKSLFWHIFSNGLNMQIEHHLFPGLNHCHLHIIQPTVQKTCEEYGVHYKSFESWSEVMGATLEWLDKLSTPI